MSEPSKTFSAEHHAAVPLWRDIRVLTWLFQLVVLGLVIALLAILGTNLLASLEAIGLNLSFGFLTRRAGFHISEGPAFDPNRPMWSAYLVGVVNTLRAAGLGIVLTTLLGTFVGIARLSRNWLVSRLALIYIEIMQNTPLLVQLFFWFVLIRSLPAQRHGEIYSLPRQTLHLGLVDIPPLVYLSQRAAALPGIQVLDSLRLWWPFLVAALIAAAVAWWVRVRLKEMQGHPATGQLWWAVTAFVAVAAIGWLAVPGAPLRIVLPTLTETETIVNYASGWVVSNNMQALVIGLVLYTAAFVAEVVRAGIQAIPRGQIEAATSLGFTRGQQLRLIVMPQAMRVIIPPLINQYLNLVKNSSLAIAVAYPDLFNVSQTIGNQTGQNIQIIAMVMATYLAMSLLISAVMNTVNRRMQIVER